jgi:hypothetical protein
MKNYQSIIVLILIAFSSCNNGSEKVYQPKYYFSVKGEKTFLNNKEILLRGLRFSNALISDKAEAELISNLDTFAYYGINSFSVYLQGSRFGDVKGYKEDCSIDTVYGRRLSEIIEAADSKGFVVLVGCLYYGTSAAPWESWGQTEADLAVSNTVHWLNEHNYRNVFIDVDNEGMARKAKNLDNRQMVLACKAIDSTYIIATNYRGDPPPEADMAIHHSNRSPGKPYAETEGSPPGVKGGYWGAYSKQGKEWNNGEDIYQYINIGVYTDSMKKALVKASFEHFDRGEGYFLASTWLQCVPPEGPNHFPGGYGTKEDPGIKWWLDEVRRRFGAYKAGMSDE